MASHTSSTSRAQSSAAAPALPAAVVAALRCSVCSAPVALDGRTLRCAAGHAFDLAKQGYVNLLHATVPKGTADTNDMVAARAGFLGRDFYSPLARALTDRVRGRLVVDAGAGTGYYLSHILDALPDAHGLALDVSATASRRAARAHPRLGSAVWNLWEPWPVRDGAADAVLNVFAPRNAAEFHRVLAPGGLLLVAGPGPGHLRELVDTLGLLDVADDREERLDAALDGRFRLADRVRLGRTVTMSSDDVRNAVSMGPNAHHLQRDGLGDRLAALTGEFRVTTSFTLSIFDRTGAPGARP